MLRGNVRGLLLTACYPESVVTSRTPSDNSRAFAMAKTSPSRTVAGRGKTPLAVAMI